MIADVSKTGGTTTGLRGRYPSVESDRRDTLQELFAAICYHETGSVSPRSVARTSLGNLEKGSSLRLAYGLSFDRFSSAARCIARLPRLILLALLLTVEQPRPALALSEKNYQGACKSMLLKWKRQGGYGAAAISKNGYCGFSWEAYSPGEARSSALAQCSAGKKGKGCVVTSTINSPSEFVKQRRLCGGLKGQASIDACSALLAKKGGDRIMRAWHFNERGRNHMSLGLADKAIADFSDSIKIYPRTDVAYFNRARLYDERGMIEEAIADFRKSVQNYDDPSEDYRSEAKGRIKELEARLKETRSLPEAKLCFQALDASLYGWDNLRPYAVREAKRRKLTLDDCLSTYIASLNSKWLCTVVYDQDANGWSTNPSYRRYLTEVANRNFSTSDCRNQIGLAP